MKKAMVLIFLLAISGLANAEMINMDFEEGMIGWGTWGSGSGSGPLGSMWTSHWAYIDSTGNGVADSNNFLNLTTTAQIGYYEYYGWGYNDAFRSPDYILEIDPGDWFRMSVWAKDVGGYGGRVGLTFVWKECKDIYEICADVHCPVPPDHFYFDVTDEWDYYEAWVQAPGCAVAIVPLWANPDPGTEIGIDNAGFLSGPFNFVVPGDHDDNFKVDLADFSELVLDWQIAYDPNDLREMAVNWLVDCTANPSDPACTAE